VLVSLRKIDNPDNVDAISSKLIDAIAIELKRLGRQVKDVPPPRPAETRLPDDWHQPGHIYRQDDGIPPEDISCG